MICRTQPGNSQLQTECSGAASAALSWGGSNLSALINESIAEDVEKNTRSNAFSCSECGRRLHALHGLLANAAVVSSPPQAVSRVPLAPRLRLCLLTNMYVTDEIVSTTQSLCVQGGWVTGGWVTTLFHNRHEHRAALPPICRLCDAGGPRTRGGKMSCFKIFSQRQTVACFVTFYFWETQH